MPLDLIARMGQTGFGPGVALVSTAAAILLYKKDFSAEDGQNQRSKNGIKPISIR
jgi:hypothetical protein